MARTVLDALEDLHLEGLAYVRGAPSWFEREARNYTVDVSFHPLELASALCDAGLVIHHGGMGLGAAALAAGRPQVILPTSGEQRRNGRALQSLDAAVSIPDHRVDAFEQALMRFRDSDWATQVHRTSSELRGNENLDGLEMVLEACRRRI